MSQLFQRRLTVCTMPASPHELSRLGFRPHFSLQTGLADAIDWWRNQLASGQTQHQSTVRKFEQKTALFASTSADDCQRLHIEANDCHDLS